MTVYKKSNGSKLGILQFFLFKSLIIYIMTVLHNSVDKGV